MRQREKERNVETQRCTASEKEDVLYLNPFLTQLQWQNDIVIYYHNFSLNTHLCLNHSLYNKTLCIGVKHHLLKECEDASQHKSTVTLGFVHKPLVLNFSFLNRHFLCQLK